MDNLNLIYFSPTETTKKIVSEIGRETNIKQIVENNITHIDSQIKPITTNNSLTIFGCPVYGGRLPLASIEALNKFKSNNQSPAVVVVVYGNREYDDALLELKDIVESNGFNVIAGAAFIGEHSYSSENKPLAANRPDKQDLIKCKNFAALITAKLKDSSKEPVDELKIPGQYPYKERKDLPVEAHPITDPNLCDNCGLCIEICPTNAISNIDTEITDGALCIHCCACVKSCPNGARIFDHPAVTAIKDRLFLNCKERKEPTFFV